MTKDQELFKGTAEYYSKYRLGYGPEFIEYIVNYFKLNGKGRLLDLGCGTGQLAIPLSKYFEEVIGIDIEQEMIDQASIQAEKAEAKNIKWIKGRAEDITVDMGAFRLVTIGAAFHWMDQKTVLEKVYNLTKKRGGLVVVYDSGYSWATREGIGEKWQQTVRNLIKKYLGKKRRAGNSFYKKPEKDFEGLIEESSFGNLETWTNDYTRTRTVESILGFLYSTSFASRRLFGDGKEEFENEVIQELFKINSEGIFIEPAAIEAILTRKMKNDVSL